MCKLIYIEYLDHWYNDNIQLTDAELKRKLEAPIILKCFGKIRYENDTYLVLENFLPPKIVFIFKSAIILRKTFIEIDESRGNDQFYIGSY